MKYKINTVSQKRTDEGWINIFKYWINGSCACTAKKITVIGDKRLSLTDMEAIVEKQKTSKIFDS